MGVKPSKRFEMGYSPISADLLLLIPLDEPIGLFVNDPARADCDDVNGVSRRRSINDPELTYAITAQTCKLVSQFLSGVRVMLNAFQRRSDLTFELRVGFSK